MGKSKKPEFVFEVEYEHNGGTVTYPRVDFLAGGIACHPGDGRYVVVPWRRVYEVRYVRTSTPPSILA